MKTNDIVNSLLSGLSFSQAINEDLASDVVKIHQQGGSIYYPNEKDCMEIINSVLDDTILGNIFVIADVKETEVDGCMFKDILIAPTPIDLTKIEALDPKYAQVFKSMLANTLQEKLDLGNHVEIKLTDKGVTVRFSIL